MKKQRVYQITLAAMIAAVYVVLTFFANALGLANNAIQVRFSEALTILPFFTGDAVWGLTIGCFLSNLFIGSAAPDVVFGTLATFLGALGTYFLGKTKKTWTGYLAPVPPILTNTFIVPWVLIKAYEVSGAYWFLAVTVGTGEIISCGVLGMMLYVALNKRKNIIFK